MYLNTDALPKAHATPRTKISAVNSQMLRPTWKVFGPFTVMIVKSVCGYESRKRQIQLTHITHHVSACAPNLSDSHPPIARNTPPGSEKHAASSAAARMSSPNSPT